MSVAWIVLVGLLGGVSPASALLGGPTAPTITSVNAFTVSPAVGNKTQPTMVVSGLSSGETVRLFDGATKIAEVLVPLTTTGQITLNDGGGLTTDPLSGEGDHHLTATATDVTGTSPPSTEFIYTLDQTPPPAPTIASVNGDTTTPALANVRSPIVVISGVTANDTIKLFDGTTKVAEKKAAGTSVSFNATTAEFAITNDGAHTLTATATDPATNVSPASAAFVYNLDTTPPAAPNVASVNGAASPVTGNDPYPSIQIAGVVAGDTVKLFDGANQIASKVVPTGQTTVGFNTAGATDARLQGGGQHTLTATSTDPVGNASWPSSAFVFRSNVVFDGNPVTTERVDRGDITAAAIAISRARFANGGASYVILSRDDKFPDALAATPLTGRGPLLFTPSGSLSTATRDEIRRVLPAGGLVYLLGGPVALTPAVEDAVRLEGYQRWRLAGPSGSGRIQTAIAVAEEVLRLHPGETRVALARAFGPTGDDSAAWADSVTGGGWAAKEGVPVLLTPTGGLDPDVNAWLHDHNPTSTILLGGEAALAPVVEQAVPNPKRVAGGDRAATAVEIAKQLWGASSIGSRRFIVVNGWHAQGWGYGLAAAGLAYEYSSPLLMVNSDFVPDATTTMVKSCGQSQVDLLLLGSTSIIPAARQTDLDNLDGQGCP